MNDAKQSTVPDIKKAFRNFAAGYAVIAPAVAIIYILLFMEIKNVPIVPAWVAAPVFISSLAMGIVNLSGKSVGADVRPLVFVGVLVSAICGGLALIACFFSRLGC